MTHRYQDPLDNHHDVNSGHDYLKPLNTFISNSSEEDEMLQPNQEENAATAPITPSSRKRTLLMGLLALMIPIGALVAWLVLRNNDNNKANNNNSGTQNREDGEGNIIQVEGTVIALEVPTDFEVSLEFSPSDYNANNPTGVTSKDPETIWFELPLSQPNTLTTLVKKKQEDGSAFLQPIGRSYDGQPWGTTAGPYVHDAEFVHCNDVSCLVDLASVEEITNGDDAGGVYMLTTFMGPSYTDRDIAARFLEQATFGPTTETIQDLVDDNLDFATWIRQQQTLTPLSHREVFRTRLNIPQETASVLGPTTHPCQKGSRCRLTAFSREDAGKTFRITVAGNGQQWVLSMNGEPRTMVPSPVEFSFVYNRQRDIVWGQGYLRPDIDYTICFLDVDVDGGSTYVSGKSIMAVIESNEEDRSVDYCRAIIFVDEEYYGTPENPVIFSNPLLRIPDNANEHAVTGGRLIDLADNDNDAQAIDEEYFDDYDGSAIQSILLQRHVSQEACNRWMTGAHGDSGTPELFYAKWGGRIYIFEPRLRLFENTVESPLPDGGGEVLASLQDPQQHYSEFGQYYGPKCANVPRNFLNEENCFLSESPEACTPTEQDFDRDQVQEAFFTLDHESIRTIYQESGGGDEGTLYLYAIDGLNVTKDPTVQSPCIPGVISRWVQVTCSSSELFLPTAQDETTNLFGRLIAASINRNSANSNPYFIDVRYPTQLSSDRASCHDNDLALKGFEVPDLTSDDATLCWRHVHPDHLDVYDFTTWTVTHPGNSDARNPIKEFAEAGQSRLMFPDWHELWRWNNFKERSVGRIPALGGQVNYFALPYRVRTDRLAQALGIETAVGAGADINGIGNGEIGGPGTLVCGSPNEVANDPELGGDTGRGSFTSPTNESRQRLSQQREIAWTIAALTDPNQLCQRIAWALSQILVVSPGAFGPSVAMSYTEPFLMYYDIFIRNAFGNYRNVLKEVSFSPMMAKMLSFYRGQSTAFVYVTRGGLQYADENYAREIMQLFTTGLFQLHKNGTQVLDQDGSSQPVYTNDDIEEYARAWTGFYSQRTRGNMEGDLELTPRFVEPNLIDPMRINEAWRDQFPKMGLDRRFVGDDYPLCIDLPARHFLARGATYRLLGRTSTPELQRDPPTWNSDADAIRLSLSPRSPLFAKLCEPEGNGQCNFPAKVVLDSSLECYGAECEVDSLRSIEVRDGIFYEYVRPPCTYHPFFNNAKVLMNRLQRDYMCGDPRTEVATVACCGGGAPVWNELFYGERTTYSTAKDRCQQNLCPISNRPRCNAGNQCMDSNYFWSDLPCALFVKINSVGKVAIVHNSRDVNDFGPAGHVNVDSKTFFRVNWEGNYEEIVPSCGNIDSCALDDDGTCICEVDVSDERVFDAKPSREEILSSLHVGAFESSVTSESRLVDTSDVGVHSLGGGAGGFSMETVFEFSDQNGRRQLRKNMRSTVNIKGTAFKFRNPPHFINLADPEPRDAHYETDATLEHYLYHRNTGPFLAIRFAQRFGISNPSPHYVESIADAFQTGNFEYKDDNGNAVSFGGGEYGDLAATFAAVLLHPEARNVVLDADPTHGAFREPLLKVLGLMRSLGFELQSYEPWVSFGESFGEKIGQMAHQLPSVFSFFLPEYQPPGSITKAGLVAPEAQRLTGPKIIDSMNGIFSLIKYGMNSCFGGFGYVGRNVYLQRPDCPNLQIGDTDHSSGDLSNRPTPGDSNRELVDELATLMTAGRLSSENRELVESVLEEGSEEAWRKAQLLIASSPEFHSTNLVRKTGEERPPEPEQSPSLRPYKALVYVMLTGGYDSYNMLVPHSCSATNAAGVPLLEQYLQERATLALAEEERSRTINADGQPCDQFGIHAELPIVERLYNDGDLTFFANTGALDVPVTKHNYYDLTQTELFAHNTMQAEAQRVDPFDLAPETGILGRMCEVLLANGHNPQPITIQDATIATIGSRITPLIVSTGDGTVFAPGPEGETFDLRDYAARMNDATSFHSSIFGETWSHNLQTAIADADLLVDAVRNVELTQEYGISDEAAGGGRYNANIRTLAQTMLTHEARGSDRDVLYLELGGWDHHDDGNRLGIQFEELNTALTLFEQEMKAQGLWDSVAMVIMSDFGRTLTPNSGGGSDHAWGGNYMVLGGSVKGGQILGQYPSDLTGGGELNVGRGRLIPTLSWESMLNGPVEWMGVDTSEGLDYCMPNRHNTGTHLFTRSELFDDNLVARALRGTS